MGEKTESRREPTVDELKLVEESLAIGARINRIRIKAGLTQQQLAEKIGLSLPAIKKMAVGEGTLQFAKLRRLAEALGVSPNEILSESAAGTQDKGLLAVLEGSYRVAGLPPLEAQELARIVAEVAGEPVDEGSEVDHHVLRRALSESLVRRFLRERAPKSG